MSKVPTWKNVSAPNYTGANYLLKNANDLRSKAVAGFGEAWNDVYETGRAGNDDRVLAEIAQMQNYDTFNQDKANLLGGLDMSRVSGDAITEALRQQQSDLMTTDEFDFDRKYRQQLMDLNIAGRQSSLANSRRSGSGGGGSGGGGGLNGNWGKDSATPADTMYFLLEEQERKLAKQEGRKPDFGKVDKEFQYLARSKDLSSYKVNQTLGNVRDLRAGPKDAKGNSKGKGHRTDLKTWLRPVGPDVPNSATNAVTNENVKKLYEIGASDKQISDYHESTQGWWGDPDPTRGAAEDAFQKILTERMGKGSGPVDENDPLVKKFQSQM